MSNNNQGWESWSNHVLMTLEKLEKKVGIIENRINENNLDTQVEIVSIKARSAVWGMIAGFVISTVVSIIIGILVYQLTTGFNGSSVKTNLTPKDPVGGAHLIIPERRELPEGFVLGDKGDIIT